MPGYDYSQIGTYFITVCTENKRCVLSKVVGVGVLDDPEIRLTEYGEIAQNCIKEMNDIYENIEIEKYVIMPNHIHFLISIIKIGYSGVCRGRRPLQTPEYPILFQHLKDSAIKNIWRIFGNAHITTISSEMTRIILQYGII